MENKITVALDTEGKQGGNQKAIVFSPNLYPFIDHGWATTIHKSQGTTVDHVKLLASYEQYRNLTYVGMSRHRHSLKVFASDLDFWREDKMLERLSHVQEKLSGFDYLDAKKLEAQMKEDTPILWHEKTIQQGRDLWNAVKTTAQSAMDQLLDRPLSTKISAESYKSPNDNEENRSKALFKFREALPAAREKFEMQYQSKYYEACEFFEFEHRYGRAPTASDKPLIKLLSESLTHLAGRLYQEQALKDGTLPDPSEVSKQAYQEFALRPQQEATLANKLEQVYEISSSTAKIMAGILLAHKDIRLLSKLEF